MGKPDHGVDIHAVFCIFCGKLCEDAEEISWNERQCLETVVIWMWVFVLVFMCSGIDHKYSWRLRKRLRKQYRRASCPLAADEKRLCLW